MTDEELIENMRKFYFEAICELQNEEDIKTHLPNLEYKSFVAIMNGLIQLIKDEIADLEKVIEIEFDSNDREIYIADLKLWKLKLDLCEKLLGEYYQVIMEEESDLNGEEKMVVFATTSSGTYFERDLKIIPSEQLNDVYRCLKKLKDGVIEADNAKERKLTNNGRLKSVHEKKEFQVRVIYEILANNVVYVIGVRIKKSDNDKKDQDEVIIRKKNTDFEFDKLMANIASEDFKAKLFSENAIIYDRIMHMLDQKRGKTSGK